MSTGIGASPAYRSGNLAWVEAFLRPQPWMAHAACADDPDPDRFFPDGAAGIDAALEVCDRCTVRSACLSYAVHEAESIGIWGGTTPRQRANGLDRAQALAARTAPRRRTERASVAARGNRDAANRERGMRKAAASGSEMAERVRAALLVLGDEIPPKLAATASLRIEHPTLSLLELGRLADPPLAKHTALARLRRLLQLAESKVEHRDA